MPTVRGVLYIRGAGPHLARSFQTNSDASRQVCTVHSSRLTRMIVRGSKTRSLQRFSDNETLCAIIIVSGRRTQASGRRDGRSG